MPISESDLVVPALKALALNRRTGLTTAELHPLLRDALKPSGRDLLTLKDRTDDNFSQKVRNLRSHDRLGRHGLANFDGARFHVTVERLRYIELFDGVAVSNGA